MNFTNLKLIKTIDSEEGLLYVYRSEFYEMEMSFLGKYLNCGLKSINGKYNPEIQVDYKTGDVKIQTTSYGSMSIDEVNDMLKSYEIALIHVPEIKALIDLYQAKKEFGLL